MSPLSTCPVIRGARGSREGGPAAGSGDRFDFAEWQADRDRLEELYRRRVISPRASRRGAPRSQARGVAYEIVSGPQTRIVATGIDLDAALRSQLETAWAESVFDDF